MKEHRHSKRVKVHLTLEVSSVFKQDNIKMDLNTPIEVNNISRTGIGFDTESELPLDYYFNAIIDFGEPDEAIYAVVKIVRRRYLEDGRFNYGCEFVGLPSIFDYIFEDLEQKNEEV